MTARREHLVDALEHRGRLGWGARLRRERAHEIGLEVSHRALDDRLHERFPALEVMEDRRM